MKKTKRLLALCLVFILSLCIFAGCGGKKGYEVLVNDESGKPVPGVSVQFCSDTQCDMGQTDANGIAAFDNKAGKYTVHVLAVPAGFAKDDTEYEAPSAPGRVTIVLKAEKAD